MPTYRLVVLAFTLSIACTDGPTPPGADVPFADMKGGGPVEPDPGLTVTLEITGPQPGIAREDLILSQSFDLFEEVSGGYSSGVTHGGPQSLTGSALLVDVAAGSFSLDGGTAFTNRDEQPLSNPDLGPVQSRWESGTAGASAPASSVASGAGSRTAIPQQLSNVGAAPSALPGRTSRISDPITPERASETLRGLTDRLTELSPVAGRRLFRADLGPYGVTVIEFDPAIGAIRRSETTRGGIVQAVTERSYERRGNEVYLSSIATTVHGPTGEPRGTFVTRFTPRNGGTQ